ncbi:dephospho-CoA kinase [Serratia plymuthica]|uniref:Dephospho-CoA kinase n=2 Tax=Serratia plymuthica TaxID=82996 RepID=A0A7T2SVL1_SERPL|nr:dephospho-CoA kinase [Serratia plymuthica]KYQ99424.1 dephospho-CoA kinase [Serratia plymuthica]QPS22479.1 dephospho-CoA kinase [Serratia plymuthica]QPS64089.1 dephospho-CoA kinase [Serratia plymuthica]RKS63505.1 dephospho-CoA kinase [Serratia plymuthica]CAI2401420.1 Dephospho-CoA kinase [Serratia plymuthica]
MAYIVALTGGIGSGKSTVAEAFARHGVEIVDADVIARQVVEPGTPALAAIAERFGNEMLLADGTLNRTALRQRIFSTPDEKRWLNQLLHPLIHQETQRQLAQVASPYALWVVPLLVENNLQARADRVLVVDVDSETQLARTITRDGINRQQAQNIVSAQATREQRLAAADDIIDNSGAAQGIEPFVAALHRRYLELAASATRQD